MEPAPRRSKFSRSCSGDDRSGFSLGDKSMYRHVIRQLGGLMDRVHEVMKLIPMTLFKESTALLDDLWACLGLKPPGRGAIRLW